MWYDVIEINAIYPRKPSELGNELNEGQSNHLNKRIKKLGLEQIYDARLKDYSREINSKTIEETLEKKMWVKLKAVDKKLGFFKSNKKDAQEAIDFLDLFVLHASKHLQMTKQREYCWKALFILENLYSELNGELELDNHNLHVKNACRTLDKILVLIPITEQKSLSEGVRKAEKILKEYYKPSRIC